MHRHRETPTAVAPGDIATVRRFNRQYTKVIGVLGEGLHDTEYSLTDARVLFELAAADFTETARLRRTLDLDPGYLSRILRRFERRGLIECRRRESDARRQEVRLTDRGRAEFAELDRRSGADVAALLAPHPADERAELLAAMRTIHRILDDGARRGEPVLREPRAGDYGWVVGRNAALYAREYGWNADYEALVARIVADFLHDRDERRERAWIAEIDGAPVGSVFCVAETDTVARLRLLLVEPSARGHGVGTALVRRCVRFAAEAGYREMVLWTNDVLTSARRIYQRHGFELVESSPHRSFGHDLLGQTWRRAL
ncbi:bifunctional helix-turn-helix transcriptional regulator/GNAT family N-acetyltransferase [Nocardia arizonensis]|uniref:bifunctional helix-turn-helix transcriptional regulator/GNAT family N-acetyltransferase n=1 Tax=Nocardia arizonensis TaxID=1141647 RepID=UPI000B2FEF08|nr:bifunctional helix-turn-helix transcriptional regulator/GNAT family N-acetyltransferase [Nocardia arizonensis]